MALGDRPWWLWVTSASAPFTSHPLSSELSRETAAWGEGARLHPWTPG